MTFYYHSTIILIWKITIKVPCIYLKGIMMSLLHKKKLILLYCLNQWIPCKLSYKLPLLICKLTITDMYDKYIYQNVTLILFSRCSYSSDIGRKHYCWWSTNLLLSFCWSWFGSPWNDTYQWVSWYDRMHFWVRTMESKDM